MGGGSWDNSKKTSNFSSIFYGNFTKYFPINFLIFPNVIQISLEPATDDSQEVRKMQKTCETQETRRKLTTQISRFDYFLVQLNFIPYCTRKSLCLVHNYCFYHKTGYRQFARHPRDEKNMRDTRNSQEKEGAYEII